MRNMREYLEMQLKLQENMKKANPDVDTGSPWDMTQEELARFITWNHTALVVELSEMMQEVGWKPWASARFVNHPQAMQEMVDAWHFFLNILLAMAAMNHMSVWEMAIQFENYYVEKNAKNLQRQVEGYDGVTGKCPSCKRDLREAMTLVAEINDAILTYCECGKLLTQTPKETQMPGKDEELEKLREDIDRRSGEGRTQSAEELTEAAQALHGLKQQQTDLEFKDPADLMRETGPEFNGRPEDVRGNDELHSNGVGGLANPHAYKMVMDAEQTGEPLFCFRARDFFSVQVIAHYADIVERYGPDDSAFHNNIVDALGEFKEWQRQNVSKVRYPD